MNARKSYLIPEGSTKNLKTAFNIPTEDRNEHHKRAKWLGAISLFLMVTIVAVPIGIPLFAWAMKEANEAERLRASR